MNHEPHRFGAGVVPEVHADPSNSLQDWFDDFRRERAAARIEPTGRRSRAIIVMVHNEPVFFPIWLRYYSQFFRPEEIYVLDHDTTDGSTEGEGFNRIPTPQDEFSHEWQVEQVEALQRELLKSHEIVVAVDVDELIVPSPAMGDLGSYLDRFDEPFVSCLGYEVVHLPDREAPFDPDRPVLEQRRFWSENSVYNKSAITTEPAEWVPGFHRRVDFHFRGDPDLRLVHLHRIDYDLCRERHRRWADRQWRSHDLDEGLGAHNRISGGDEFDSWYFGDSGFDRFRLRIEEIPSEWRGSF